MPILEYVKQSELLWAANLQKKPAMVAVLAKEGLTAKANTRGFAALLQAGLAAALQKSGVKQIPEGTNPANVKLVMDHEQELQKMQRAWADVGGKDQD